MRHRKKFNHLSRTSAHRKAMLSNMATSLILHKRITTTVQKAKALRSYVEPLITRSKEDTTHSRRMVFSYLQSKEAVTELFREISTKVADRPGGYTRIIKMPNRLGDNAEMCLIELVDYNENLLGGGKEKAKPAGKRRRRRGGKSARSHDEGMSVDALEVTPEGKTVEVKDEPPAVEEEDVKTESTDDVEKTTEAVEEAVAEPEKKEVPEAEEPKESPVDEMPKDEKPRESNEEQPEKKEDDVEEKKEE